MSSPDLRRRTGPALALSLAALALVAAGCRQDMHNQPKLKPYRSSDFFADGSGIREIPAHTVARGELREDKLFFTGRAADGSMTTELPMPMTRALLLRGRERYDIFCSPCHGKLGDGRGMVVQRGYKQPPSYHEARLREAPVGYFFDVMTNGFGVMSTYAPQVPPADRWAIAAYIRALQLSQHVDAGTLAPEDRARLDQPVAAESDAHSGEAGHH
ncbi:MAG: cytochrome c [Thermoanaerobaculia bacterium]